MLLASYTNPHIFWSAFWGRRQDLGFNDSQKLGVLVVLSAPWISCFKHFKPGAVQTVMFGSCPIVQTVMFFKNLIKQISWNLQLVENDLLATNNPSKQHQTNQQTPDVQRRGAWSGTCWFFLFTTCWGPVLRGWVCCRNGCPYTSSTLKFPCEWHTNFLLYVLAFLRKENVLNLDTTS